MILSVILRGILTGLIVAMPVGPLGMLCIRRTLAEGRRYGFVSGLGVAAGDAVFGAIGAFGLTAAVTTVLHHRLLVGILSALILCALGIHIFLTDSQSEPRITMPKTYAVAFSSTFLLTLSNPLTILSFAALFTGAGLTHVGTSLLLSGLLTISVFVGSALWWLMMTSLLSLFHHRITSREIRWINKISGACIVFFGVLIALEAIGNFGHF